ncbi:MAG: hypothetical protein O2914_03760 [Bacteroidetes bacterium]|nr:hypothetical protein [Bacteroidota bacterium]MDA0937932.1 hypothetical protein [Bacteroidota bacterium]MDA1344038.1 hypothetical protein [Bacteroidota bacterium]
MSTSLKKYTVLTILFVFPVVIYLFFASGKNNFAKLPVLTKSIASLEHFETQGPPVTLENKITILGFWGQALDRKKGDALNLNEKIYKRFYQFADFQFVMLIEQGQQNEAEALKASLREGVGTDLQKWNFLFGTKEDLQTVFSSLQTPLTLDQQGSTPYVFIIDKKAQLRGRNDDEDIGVLYGFNAESVAEINNKMVDDVKVILAEYRLALKKYNADRKK